jgi:hypothetical protein
LIFARIHVRECVVIYCHCFRDRLDQSFQSSCLNLKIKIKYVESETIEEVSSENEIILITANLELLRFS